MPKTRADLILKVQEICQFWDVAAQNAAMEAVRHHGTAKREEATRAVARADAVHHVEKLIIEAILAHWPQQEN